MGARQRNLKSFYHVLTDIYFISQCDTTYFSISDWSTLDFMLTDVPLTRLGNVRQLNIRRGKKLGFKLSHRQPRGYFLFIEKD